MQEININVSTLRLKPLKHYTTTLSFAASRVITDPLRIRASIYIGPLKTIFIRLITVDSTFYTVDNDVLLINTDISL